MLYLKINDNEIEYPYNPSSLRVEFSQTSFPSQMSEELLSEYDVYPVSATEKPVPQQYFKVIESSPIQINGIWTQQWQSVPADIPQLVSPRQVRLLLLNQGLLDQVEAMIAQQDRATQITWEFATEFQRDDPLLNALALNLNLSKEQIDHFFIDANQL